MKDQVFDVEWYREAIADPDTGRQVRFTGTPFGNVNLEMDAFWYGVEFENRRRTLEHDLIGVFGLIDAFAGREPRKHRLDLLDSTAWVVAFNSLWDVEDIPAHVDPANAVNFRLDVIRAMAALPRASRRALTHALDGYERAEVASLMGWLRPMSESEQEEARIEGERSERVPNVDTANRVIRGASTRVRGMCGIAIRDVPKPPDDIPEGLLPAGVYKVDVIGRVEAEIASIRAWRRREEARKRQNDERMAA